MVVFNFSMFWSNCLDNVSVCTVDSTVLASQRMSVRVSIVFIFFINWSLAPLFVLWIRNNNLMISSLLAKVQSFATSWSRFEMLFKNKQNIIYFRPVITFGIKTEIVEHLVGLWTSPVQYSLYTIWF